MKTPRATPAALQALARGDIANLATAMMPGGIEAQEAAGQAKLCGALNDLLPIDGTISGQRGRTDNRATLESWGFVFADKPEDDLFVSAKFPAGWKKVASDHSMWSKLVDDKGRERGAIFYKAAFYDRSAHMSLTRRYSCGADYDQKEPHPVVVKDCGKVIHTVGTERLLDWKDREKARADYDFNQSLRVQGKAWLDQNYPEWKDAAAYWD